MSLSWRSILFPVLILGVTVAGVTTLIATKPKQPARGGQEQTWRVSALAVQTQTLAPSVPLYGVVESPEQATFSAALAAEVRTVAVRAGQLVAAGDVLLQLDDRDAQLLLIQREADIAELQTQLDSERLRHEHDQLALVQEQALLNLARNGVERVRQLLKTQAMAQTTLDEALQVEARQALTLKQREYALREHATRQAQLAARLRRVQALRDQAQMDLGRAELRAAVASRITAVLVAPGTRVRVGDALLSLYPKHSVEIRAQIPERHLPQVQAALDQGVALSAQMEGAGVPLRLVRLAQAQAKTSGGRDAYLQPQGELPLALGQPVSLWLELPPVSGVIVAPSTALYGLDRIYPIVDDRLQAAAVDYLGLYRAPAAVAGAPTQVLLRAAAPLPEGTRLLTTQLPNAATGLKVQVVAAP